MMLQAIRFYIRLPGIYWSIIYLLKIVILLYVPFAFASFNTFKKSALENVHSIKMILTLPLENRRQVLLSRYKSADLPSVLRPIIFNKFESMNLRWSALIGLAYSVDSNQSRLVVTTALKHRTWFLRNAGLIAMEILDSSISLQWADHLLDDPSLIVRTAAVDLIRRHKADQYKFRLLEKLNAPDSFYKNTSLWIRKHIVLALADFAEPGEKNFFISLLKDPDSRLHSPAHRAIQKLASQQKLVGKQTLTQHSLITNNHTP